MAIYQTSRCVGRRTTAVGGGGRRDGQPALQEGYREAWKETKKEVGRQEDRIGDRHGGGEASVGRKEGK